MSASQKGSDLGSLKASADALAEARAFGGSIFFFRWKGCVARKDKAAKVGPLFSVGFPSDLTGRDSLKQTSGQTSNQTNQTKQSNHKQRKNERNKEGRKERKKKERHNGNTDIQTNKQANNQTSKQITQIKRDRQKQTDRNRQTETDRQKQADRNRQTQADRQKQTNRNRQTKKEGRVPYFEGTPPKLSSEGPRLHQPIRLLLTGRADGCPVPDLVQLLELAQTEGATEAFVEGSFLEHT